MVRSEAVRFDRLAFAFLVALNVAGWFASLDNEFSLDDYNWLARARFAPSAGAFVLEPEPGQLFTPVTKGFFWGLYAVGGENPIVYRLAILAIHILNAFFVYRLGTEVLRRRRGALLAASLFSLNSCANEAVFWIAAFYHPVTAVFSLATLVGFVRYVRSGKQALLFSTLALFAAGLLCKASFYAVLIPMGAYPLLLAWRPDARRRGWIGFAVGVVLVGIAIGANAWSSVGGSYLVQRGYYTVGWHMAANLDTYLVRVFFPFEHAFGKVGLGASYVAIFEGLRWLLPVALIALFGRGGRGARWSLVLLLAGVLPYLPFTMEPTSRYSYLASTAAGLIGGGLLDRIARRFARRRSWERRAAMGVCAAILLAFALDTWIEDNDYEYRERLMEQLVEDAKAVYPELPSGAEVVVLDLPRFAVDRGIHLEAALRLAYDDPAFRLIAPDPLESETPFPEGERVLVFKGNRIVRLEHVPPTSFE
ncbi:hypothetical protein JW916_10080 [Candidatus Sumerlaeota bacterium]|nr:hypothetical protein [Candidatus Sumerlaeota bacterium]